MIEIDDYKNIQRGCGAIKMEYQENIEDAQSQFLNIDGCNKLYVHDYLDDIPLPSGKKYDLVEVRFKNTRKAFYRNVNDLPLKEGDVVAVEASPGHDIGVVSLVGPMVELQMKKCKVYSDQDFKKVYRLAKPQDIEKWKFYNEKEDEIMLKSRQIADSLHLNMKIGDVEFQGDGTKAIFYYIADERVDFRELIKIMADEFKIRIEMKQIGARQEAGRIGGIGPCGRELCCTTWITNFVSVSTNSARLQELSLNPQKLAGQCGKLKCCLNYETDAYIDAQKDFPHHFDTLETMEGTAYYQKMDIFKRLMWYSYDRNTTLNLTAVDVDRVKEILYMNRNNQKPDTLLSNDKNNEQPSQKKRTTEDYQNAVETDSITRFDKLKKKKNRNKNKNKNKEGNKEVNKEVGKETAQEAKEEQNQEAKVVPQNNTEALPKQEQPSNKPSQQPNKQEQVAKNHEQRSFTPKSKQHNNNGNNNNANNGNNNNNVNNNQPKKVFYRKNDNKPKDNSPKAE